MEMGSVASFIPENKRKQAAPKLKFAGHEQRRGKNIFN